MVSGAVPTAIDRRLISLRRSFANSKERFDLLEGVRVKEQQDAAPRRLMRSEQLSLIREAGR